LSLADLLENVKKFSEIVVLSLCERKCPVDGCLRALISAERDGYYRFLSRSERTT
jgi:hypothetical protein